MLSCTYLVHCGPGLNSQLNHQAKQYKKHYDNDTKCNECYAMLDFEISWITSFSLSDGNYRFACNYLRVETSPVVIQSLIKLENVKMWDAKKVEWTR